MTVITRPPKRLPSLLVQLPGIGRTKAVEIVAYLAAHPDLAQEMSHAMEDIASAGLCLCGMPANKKYPRDEDTYWCSACASEDKRPVFIVPTIRVANRIIALGNKRAFVLDTDMNKLPETILRFKTWLYTMKWKTTAVVPLMMTAVEKITWEKYGLPLVNQYGIPIEYPSIGLLPDVSVDSLDDQALTSVLSSYG